MEQRRYDVDDDSTCAVEQIGGGIDVLDNNSMKNFSFSFSSSSPISASDDVSVDAKNVEHIIIPTGWPIIAMVTLAVCACFETWLTLCVVGYGSTLPRLWVRARLKVHFLVGYVFVPLNWIATIVMFMIVCRNKSWMKGINITRHLRVGSFLIAILAVIATVPVINNINADVNTCIPSPCYASNRTGNSKCDRCTDENFCRKSWGYSHDVAYCHTQPTMETPIMCGYRNCHILDDCATLDVRGIAQQSMFVGFPIEVPLTTSAVKIEGSAQSNCGGFDAVNILMTGGLRVLFLVWISMVPSNVLYNHEEKIKKKKNGVINQYEKKNTWTTVPFPLVGSTACCVSIFIEAWFFYVYK